MKFLLLLFLCSCITQIPKATTVMIDGKKYELPDGAILRITTTTPAPVQAQAPQPVQQVAPSASVVDDMDLDDEEEIKEPTVNDDYISAPSFDSPDEAIESDIARFHGEIKLGETGVRQ